MVIDRSCRAFLKQATTLAAVSGSVLRSAWARQTKFVTANTTAGMIRGVDFEGIRTFKGIPYGASTAGANRFMPPTDPAPWTGVRDALEFGPSAPQRRPGRRQEISNLAVAARGLPSESEDCLVLNV